MDQRLGEAEPLPVALRQHAGLLVAIGRETNPVDDPVDGAGIGHTAQAAYDTPRYRKPSPSTSPGTFFR